MKANGSIVHCHHKKKDFLNISTAFPTCPTPPLTRPILTYCWEWGAFGGSSATHGEEVSQLIVTQ